jgi:hypothetical protein
MEVKMSQNKMNCPIKDVIRFWGFVNIPKDYMNECWQWLSAMSKGYGEFWFNGKKVSAHRFAYEYYNGPISNGAQICHNCNNKGCTSPYHLREDDSYGNMQDRKNNGDYATGDENSCTTVPDIMVKKILTDINDYKLNSIKQIMTTYNVSRPWIYDLLKGTFRRDISNEFSNFDKFYERVVNKQMTPDKVRQVRKLLNQNKFTLTYIAKIMNSNRQTIADIRNGRTWINIK